MKQQEVITNKGKRLPLELPYATVTQTGVIRKEDYAAIIGAIGTIPTDSHIIDLARNSITLTTTGSGPATYDPLTGALNIPVDTYTADNGLTMAANNVQLGGMLSHQTEIDLNGQEFYISSPLSEYVPFYTDGTFTALRYKIGDDRAEIAINYNSAYISAQNTGSMSMIDVQPTSIRFVGGYGAAGRMGTVTELAAFDSNGFLLGTPAPSFTYNAENGLTMASNVVKLGGALTQNTDVALGSSYEFKISSTSEYSNLIVYPNFSAFRYKIGDDRAEMGVDQHYPFIYSSNATDSSGIDMTPTHIRFNGGYGYGGRTGTPVEIAAFNVNGYILGVPVTDFVSSSQTANRVIVSNGSGVVTTSSNAVWDYANSRMGIGTTSPSFDLDIYNATASANIRIKSGALSGNLILDRFGVTANAAVIHRTNGTDIWSSGMSNRGTDSDWYLLNGNIVSGTIAIQVSQSTSDILIPLKLGIGRTPQYKLDVAVVNPTGGLAMNVENTGSTTGIWTRMKTGLASSDTWQFGVNASGYRIYDETAAAYRWTIDNSGYVFIYADPVTSPGSFTLLTRSTAGRIESVASTYYVPAISLSGIADYTARWITSSTLGTGVLRDNGTGVGIGTAPITGQLLTIFGSSPMQMIKNTGTTGWAQLILGNTADQYAGQIFTNGSSETSYAGVSSLNIMTNGAFPIGLSTFNALRWTISSTGHLIPSGNNNYDIGSSAVGIRNIYVGTNGTFGATVTATTFTDGYITMSAAQINRASNFVEVQYAASGGVRFFGNTVNAVSFSSLGAVTLSATPTTSAGAFALLTRNSSTGVVESISSAYYVPSTSLSGTSDYLARWTSSSTLGIGVTRDNGSTVGFGTAPVASRIITASGQSRFTSGVAYSAINTGWSAAIGYSGDDFGVRIGASSTGGIIQVAELATSFPLYIQPYGSNMLVGSTTDDGTNKLQVTGTARFSKASGAAIYIYETGGNTGDAAALYLQGNSGSWGGSIRFNVGAGGVVNTLDFYNGSVKALTIAPTGASTHLNSGSTVAALTVSNSFNGGKGAVIQGGNAADGIAVLSVQRYNTTMAMDFYPSNYDGNRFQKFAFTMDGSDKRVFFEGAGKYIFDGHIVPNTTNAQDIGISATNLIRTIYTKEVKFGSSTNAQPYIFTYTTNAGVDVLSGTNLTFYNNTIANAATAGAFTFAGSQFSQASGTQVFVQIEHGITTPVGSTAGYIQLRLAGTFNETNGGGTIRTIKIEPTLTSVADYRAIEITTTSGRGIYQTNSAVISSFLGNVGVGVDISSGGVDKLTAAQTSTANNATAIFANATGANTSGTSYSGYFIKIAGAGGTGIAGYFSATGGTNNYAINVAAGDVKIVGLTNATGDFVTYNSNSLLRVRTASQVITDIGAVSTTQTANRFLVTNSSGVVTVTSDAYWDWTNSKMGIGLTTPQSQLHIYKSNSGGVGGQLILDNNGSFVGNATSIVFADSAGNGTANKAEIRVVTESSPFAGSFQFYTGANTAGLTEKMRLFGNGSLAIGATTAVSSAWKFLIGGVASDSANVQAEINGSNANGAGVGSAALNFVKSASTQYNTIGFYTSSTRNFYVSHFNDGTFRITRDGQSDITLNSSGSVGINQTNPATARLEIVATNVGQMITGPYDQLRLVSNSNTNVFDGAVINFQNNGSKRFDLQIGSSTSNTRVGANNFGLYDQTNGVARWVVDQSGFFGVNTISPAYRFHVEYSGTSIATAVLNPTLATGTGFAAMYFGRAATTLNAFGFNYNYVGAGSTSNYVSANHHGVDNIMVWAGTGYVGVGIAAPTANLHVSRTTQPNGDIALFESTNTSGGYSTVTLRHNNNSANNVLGRWGADNNGIWFGSDSTGSNLRFRAGGTDHAMLLSTGLLGLGLTAPLSLLHLKKDNIANRGQLSIEASDYAQITFYKGATTTTHLGGQIYYDVSGNTFRVQNYNGGSYGYLLLNPDGGSVGIGIGTPAARLHIRAANGGQLRLDNAGEQYTALDFYNNAVRKGVVEWENTGLEFNIKTFVASSSIVFKPNDTIAARINSSGLTISTISALGTGGTVFLTHTGGLVQSRTASEVQLDINALYTSSNGLTMTSNNTKIGGSWLNDTNITGAFNFGLDDSTLSVGAAATVGGARIYSIKGTAQTGQALYAVKNTTPSGSDFGSTSSFQRGIASTSFASNVTQTAIYGQLELQGAGFNFSGSGAYTPLSGITGAFTIGSASGTFTAGNSVFSGVYGYINIGGSGTIDKVAAIRASIPVQNPNIASFSGTITNYYGLYLDDQGSGLYAGNTTNRWAVYQAGAADINYFGGAVRLNTVGTNTTATSLLVRNSTTKAVEERTLASFGFLTSYSETDPIYTASTWYSTTNNASNWNSAYTWVSTYGYTDYLRYADYSTAIGQWNTAYGWGNHASAGYVTASSTNTFTNKSGNISQWINNVGYLTSVPSLSSVVAAGNSTSSDIYTGNLRNPSNSNYIKWAEDGNGGVGIHTGSGSAVVQFLNLSNNVYVQQLGTVSGRFIINAGTAASGLEVSTSYGLYLSGSSTQVSSLAGSGTRMVVADGSGNLSTQAIPSGGSLQSVTNSGNSTTNDINVVNGSSVTLINLANLTTEGIIQLKASGNDNYYGRIRPSNFSAFRDIYLPNASGTLMLENAVSGTFTASDGTVIEVTNGRVTAITPP